TAAGGAGSATPIRSWQVQSSTTVGDDGAALSAPGHSTHGWYVAPARSTVVAALLADGLYPDVFRSTNLRAIDPALFQVPWWYRSTFTVNGGAHSGRTVLRADGVIPGADVWVNGKQVATRQTVQGAYTVNDIDISSVVRPGENAIAFKIPPADPDKDLSIGWVDWNQTPPDNNMGIWRDVEILRTGDVSLHNAHVTPELSLPSLDHAGLTVAVDAHNAAATAATVDVAGTVGGHGAPIAFGRRVDLGPGETRTVTFTPADTPALNVRKPAVWWPAGEGAHPLYDLKVTASLAGAVSDRASAEFGIRSVTSSVAPGGGRQFVVNGRKIQLRGGGWAPDMFLRDDQRRTAAQLGYVTDLGLNTVRLEGKLENPEFFDMADRDGIMVLPGWECCDKWEAWAGTGGEDWTAEDHTTAVRSAASEAVLLNNHPSVVAFLIGSDNAPPADIAKSYTDAFGKAGWSLPLVSAASDQSTSATGDSGMKMTGPYAYVPPNYWYSTRDDEGGAVGFNSETSAGEAIPRQSTLDQMMTPEEQRQLWQEPGTAQYHAGGDGSQFADLSLFDNALTERYGAPTALSDYVRKSQLANYEATRAQFEAYGSRADAAEPATGVIYWMLNSAWPSLHWHLFDHNLDQAGGYFGAKKANEPVHIQYGYDSQAVQVVNHTPDATGALTANVQLRDLDGTVKLDRRTKLAPVPGGHTADAATVAPPAGLTSTYFVELTLTDSHGKQVSHNVYWTSTKPDVLDHANTTWYYTPQSAYADLTGLERLSAADVRSTVDSTTSGGRTTTRVTLRNAGTVPAVDLHATVLGARHGAEVVPVSWSDDDITLFPGQRTTLTATYRTADLHGDRPAVDLTGFNTPERPKES
ncbi:sugar-binding domain-containing protein, partial [Streptomyces sp. 150FB]|uniref:glycoside hydrolase family 2 protein n=1 Tax=Streptomyces sp. 150FB TaxID=1576605 RepID=UPI000696DF14